MTELRFVAYPKDDPNGTPLGELSHATGKDVQIEFGVGLGAGSFVINRHDSQAVWAATDTWIKVYLDGIAGLSDPIFAFRIEGGDDDLIDRDEEGAEGLTRGGQGALKYTRNAIIRLIEQTPNFFTIGDDHRWKWRDRKVGTILRDVLRECQADDPNTLPDLTWSWTNEVDSAGQPFDEVDGVFALPVGANLFDEILPALQKQGLTVYMEPDLELKAYQDYDPPVRSVTFQDGVNLRESSTRKVQAKGADDGAVSVVMLQGRRGGADLFRTYHDAAAAEAIGVDKAIFVKYGPIATPARLEKYARKLIASRLKSHEGTITFGVEMGDGTQADQGLYAPFVDFNPGDVCHFTVAGEFTDIERPVDRFHLYDGEAGEAFLSLDINVPDTNPTSEGGADEGPLPPFRRTTDDVVFDVTAGATEGGGSSYGISGSTTFPDDLEDGATFGLEWTYTNGPAGTASQKMGFITDPDDPYFSFANFLPRADIDGGVFGDDLGPDSEAADAVLTGSGTFTWDVEAATIAGWSPGMPLWFRVRGGGYSGFERGRLVMSGALGATSPAPNQPLAVQTLFIGDGVTTVGHFAWPYVPGSVRITVGGVEVQVVESDPATGEFTIPSG